MSSSTNNTLNNMQDNNTTTNLVINKDTIKDSIMKSGKQILDENDFFKNLNNIMENTDFKLFYDKYFKDFNDIKVVILYMKLYETVQKEYKDKYNCDIESEMLIFIIKELFNENSSRKYIFESFQNYIDGKNSKDKKFILDIFEKKDNGNLIQWVKNETNSKHK